MERALFVFHLGFFVGLVGFLSPCLVRSFVVGLRWRSALVSSHAPLGTHPCG
jgi:hypothetical protein